jgi:hypothetical protein
LLGTKIPLSLPRIKYGAGSFIKGDIPQQVHLHDAPNNGKRQGDFDAGEGVKGRTKSPSFPSLRRRDVNTLKEECVGKRGASPSAYSSPFPSASLRTSSLAKEGGRGIDLKRKRWLDTDFRRYGFKKKAKVEIASLQDSHGRPSTE